MGGDSGEDDPPNRTELTETDHRNGTRTTRRTMIREHDACAAEQRKRCDSCGRLFKNDRGVAIHKGKMKCEQKQTQRRRDSPIRNTQEDLGQDLNHSAQDLQATAEGEELQIPRGEAMVGPILEKKPRLCLPAATDKQWKELDDDLDQILANTLKGPAWKKIESMTRTVYNICAERFTEKGEKPKKGKAGPSRRQREIAGLRKDIRRLNWRSESTRLNSSHTVISYAVFCLKKKIKFTLISISYPFFLL